MSNSSRRYNYNQAKSVEDGISRILNRINRNYAPLWMTRELDEIYHTAQCVRGEFRQIMKGYGDE